MIHGGNCSAAVVAARDEFIDSKVPFMVMAATLDSHQRTGEQVRVHHHAARAAATAA